MCDYDTNPNYFKSRKEIEEFTASKLVNFNLFSSDIVMQISNYTNPVDYFIQDNY